MEHRGYADAGTQMLRVGGDGRHRLRRRLEQQAVERSLVLGRDLGDLGGLPEHDMEVANREQVGLALRQPGARGGGLAARTVPVATAVIGDPPVPAVGAGLDVPAHDGGAAGLYRRHHLELIQTQMPGTGDPVRMTRGAKDVDDLDGGAQRPQPPVVLPCAEVIASRSNGLATLRNTRVATVV